jgi:hypothetical protein
MCRRRCGAHTVAALMLSTSAREPARTSGTRGVGGERDGESEPKRAHLRTRAGHQHIRQVLRLRGRYGRPTIYRRLRRRNVSADCKLVLVMKLTDVLNARSGETASWPCGFNGNTFCSR